MHTLEFSFKYFISSTSTSSSALNIKKYNRFKNIKREEQKKNEASTCIIQ